MLKRVRAELDDLRAHGVTRRERRRMWITVAVVGPAACVGTIWFMQRFGGDPGMVALFFGLACLVLGLALPVIVLALKLMLRQR